MNHKQLQQDVIVVHCNWSERFGDTDAGDFIEVWASGETSLPGIANSVLDADYELNKAFSAAGIEGEALDKIMLEWLRETLASAPYKPVWDAENEWAKCLGWWDIARMAVQGVPDCSAALDYAHEQYVADCKEPNE